MKSDTGFVEAEEANAVISRELPGFNTLGKRVAELIQERELEGFIFDEQLGTISISQDITVQIESVQKQLNEAWKSRSPKALKKAIRKAKTLKFPENDYHLQTARREYDRLVRFQYF